MIDEKTKDEGPRSFSVTLAQIDDGALHSELSEKLQAVVKDLTKYTDVYRTSAKGQIVLTVSLKAEPNGTVAVHGEVKTKTPPPRRSASLFWATKGNNLSAENPRQQKLPLREVQGPAAPRDVAGDERPARTV